MRDLPTPLANEDLVSVESAPNPSGVASGTLAAGPVSVKNPPPLPPGRRSNPGLNADAFLPPLNPAAFTATVPHVPPPSAAAPALAVAPVVPAAPLPPVAAVAAPALAPPAVGPAAPVAPVAPVAPPSLASAPSAAAPSITVAPTPPPPRPKQRPWWEELFNDDYIRTMARLTDEQFAKEVDFIEESLGVQRGGMILDLACGTGRHAVDLTKRGYRVVALDLSLAMLAKAAEEAQERSQKLNFVQGDMRELAFEATFDGIYCWNTSFGFFDDEKNADVIARIHRALKRGGQFVLDVANRDFVVNQAPSLAWFEGDGCVCMDEMQIDWLTSRLRTKRTMMMEDGRSKEIEYTIRLYSPHELGKLLNDHGFRVTELSGRISTPGVYFGPDSPRTLVLAEKR
jgi:SAM-dependent methyltransferase